MIARWIVSVCERANHLKPILLNQRCQDENQGGEKMTDQMKYANKVQLACSHDADEGEF